MRGMLSKLVRNEHRKLSATGLNAVAISALVVGFLQPIFGGSGVPLEPFRVIMSFVLAVALHLLARSALDQLED